MLRSSFSRLVLQYSLQQQQQQRFVIVVCLLLCPHTVRALIECKYGDTAVIDGAKRLTRHAVSGPVVSEGFKQLSPEVEAQRPHARGGLAFTPNCCQVVIRRGLILGQVANVAVGEQLQQDIRHKSTTGASQHRHRLATCHTQQGNAQPTYMRV